MPISSRSRATRVVVAALLIAGAAGCSNDEPAAVDGGGGDGGAPTGDTGATAQVCPWGKDWPALTLPISEVKGVLHGQSRNASTTCTRQKGTGGPETFYLLTVKQRTTVELQVESIIDTVLAIRSVCDDPLTEVACNDTPADGTPQPQPGGGVPTPAPPPFVTDAGVPQPSDGMNAHVRATLDPGTYYVLVDEAAPYGVGGDFTLHVHGAEPAANAMCAAARPLMDGASLPAEELDVAFEKPPVCAGVDARPGLFYSAKIPSGQRLTARATVTGGDRFWDPVIQLVTACSGGRCLERDRTTETGAHLLRYVNNGPTTEEVILSVSPSQPVSGGTFRLDVSISEPVQNGTCASARPLSDGLVLRNQDLSEGQVSSPNGMCKPTGGPSLFYSARLLPMQSLAVTVTPAGGGQDGFVPFFLLLHGSCAVMDCRQGGQNQLQYTNDSGSIQTVIVEVSGLPGVPTQQAFDLTASLPLPPGQIIVSASNGLVTTEAGGTATFDVVLGVPPTAPVTIPIISGNTGEGTVSPAMLTFTPSDWSRPQRVTVTGADDSRRDGNQQYTVTVAASTSQDPRYQALAGGEVQVMNLDDEASLSFVGEFPLVTSESGTSTVVNVSLNKKPTADVTVSFSSSLPTEGTVTPASMTFTADNWSVPQPLTVTGVDDTVTDGPRNYTILTAPLMSADRDYDGYDPPDLDALNADNEFIFDP